MISTSKIIKIVSLAVSRLKKKYIPEKTIKTVVMVGRIPTILYDLSLNTFPGPPPGKHDVNISAVMILTSMVMRLLRLL